MLNTGRKTKLPENSLLRINSQKYDYVDSYIGVCKDREKNLNAVDIGKAFFTSGPKWIDRLFIFRNQIVSVFGLKTSREVKDRSEKLRNFRLEPGEQLGLFKVYNKSVNEVIIGEDDKHLNFRVSLFFDPK